MKNAGGGEGAERDPRHCGRREFVALAGSTTALATGAAGCLGLDFGGNTGGIQRGDADQEPGGAPLGDSAVAWDDLGDLAGEVTIYVGRTRDQIHGLFEGLEDTYPDLTIRRDYDDNATLLNKLREEGTSTPADLFYTQSGGSLAAMKANDLAHELPADVVEAVDATVSDPDGLWTGVSGRVRAVLYNAEYWDGAELPEDIFAYAEEDRFAGEISTRPNSGSFRSFIVAMLKMEGEARTREWVRAMVEDQDVTLYGSGSQQALAVHNGEQSIALGNQYYAGRIIATNPGSPLRVTFTRADAGSLFNVAGVAITAAAGEVTLASEVVRHLLAREAQEFFVEANGEYPVVDGIEYVGDLPTPQEIEPPAFDLNRLGDVEQAVDLLREEGMSGPG